MIEKLNKWYRGKTTSEWTIIADNFTRIDPLLVAIWGERKEDKAAQPRGHNFFSGTAFEVGRMGNTFLRQLESDIMIGKYYVGRLEDLKLLE